MWRVLLKEFDALQKRRMIAFLLKQQLNADAVPTLAGGSSWHLTNVARLVKRIAA